MFRYLCPCLFCCLPRSASYSSLSSSSSSPPLGPASPSKSSIADTTSESIEPAETTDLLDDLALDSEDVDLMDEAEAEKFYKSQLTGAEGEAFVEMTRIKDKINANGKSWKSRQYKAKSSHSHTNTRDMDVDELTLEVSDLTVEMEEFESPAPSNTIKQSTTAATDTANLQSPSSSIATSLTPTSQSNFLMPKRKLTGQTPAPMHLTLNFNVKNGKKVMHFNSTAATVTNATAPVQIEQKVSEESASVQISSFEAKDGSETSPTAVAPKPSRSSNSQTHPNSSSTSAPSSLSPSTGSGSGSNRNSNSSSVVSPGRGSGSTNQPKSPTSPLPRRASGESKTHDSHSAAKKSPALSSRSLHHLSTLSLPSGMISRHQMDEFLTKLDSSSLSYRGLFAFLLTAPHRVLPGEVLKSYLKPILDRFHHREKDRKHGKYPPKGKEMELDDELPEVIFHFLEFLLKFTREFVVDRKKRVFTVRFDFPSGASSHVLELNTPNTWVLVSKHASDPYLVCSANTPVRSTVETRRLVFQKEVEFTLAPPAPAGSASAAVSPPPGSILSVRDGDIQLKKYLSFNAGFRFEHKPNLADFDSENRTYLECTRGGKPIVRNNHYVPKTYDDWLVVTVLKQEVLIGLPRF